MTSSQKSLQINLWNILTVYPKVIPLMTSGEILKYCKIPFMLQFHVPNRETHSKEYPY